MAPPVAKNVKGEVMTSVPGPAPTARYAMSRASVPLAQPTAYLLCEISATLHSSSSTGLPRMNVWSSTTFIRDATISSRMVACWARRSSRGTDMSAVSMGGGKANPFIVVVT